jgi:ABC-type Fe3+ transport system permease subunit
VLSAAFLAVALVLGEFTIASLLNRENLQVGINLLGKRDAQMSVAVSLAALVVAFVLLMGLSLAGGRRRRGGPTVTGPAVASPALGLPPTTGPVTGVPTAPAGTPGGSQL